jgi:hypothetical protein
VAAASHALAGRLGDTALRRTELARRVMVEGQTPKAVATALGVRRNGAEVGPA